MTKQSCFLTALFLLTFTRIAIGQGKNEEVTIIAPYIPTIGSAAKIPFRPEITPEEQEKSIFEYNYITKNYNTTLELDPIEPFKYNVGEQEKLYRNYAKIGMGNYITPYLDFMASSLQSDNYQFGVRLKHLSSQGKIKDYPPSAYSHNLVSVYGRSFTRTHTISADVGYKRDVVHFYGFRPDNFPEVEFTKDDLKQRFQDIHGTLEFGSNFKDKSRLNHNIRLGSHYYSDFYNTRESQVSLMVGLDKAFKSIGNDFKHAFKLEIGMDYLGYNDSISSFHPLFIPIRPAYRFAFGPYRFEIGLNIEMAATDNPAESSFSMDVFPVLKAEVVVIEETIKAFAEITGSRTINSFRSLTGMNPYITSTPMIKYTDEQIKLGGGITGNFSGLNFTADAYYSFLNDMPLFVTDTTLELQNKFNVIYDNMNILQVKASLGYIKIKDLSARLYAAYYHYIPKNEEKAWHMPNYEIGLDAAYTLQEKYTLRASILTLGSKYAKTYQGGQVEPALIGGAFDLGAGFEYKVNRMISAYVDVNNILNQNYQRYFEYPVQGILVMAGAKISF